MMLVSLQAYHMKTGSISAQNPAPHTWPGWGGGARWCQPFGIHSGRGLSNGVRIGSMASD